MCKIVTKKRLTIFMTLGVIPLLLCYTALFAYGFFIVKPYDDERNFSLFLLMPPCLMIVFYVLFLGCFYLDLLFKNNKSLIISALHILGFLFHMAIGASLVFAISFANTHFFNESDTYFFNESDTHFFNESDTHFFNEFDTAGKIMTSGLVLIVLCGAIGFSLWPFTLSREDSFNTVGCEAKLRELIADFKSQPIIGIGSLLSFSVIAYLIYISGVITFTAGMVEVDFLPAFNSFYLVPSYLIVGFFPVLIVSTLIYNIWEKKVAGYLITPTSCLLSVLIGFCLLNHAYIQYQHCKFFFDYPYSFCNGSVITLVGISLMVLVKLVHLLLWSHLFLFANMHRTVDETDEGETVNLYTAVNKTDEDEMMINAPAENMPFDDDEKP